MISPLMIDLKGLIRSNQEIYKFMHLQFKDSRGGSGFIHLEGMDDLIAIE